MIALRPSTWESSFANHPTDGTDGARVIPRSIHGADYYDVENPSPVSEKFSRTFHPLKNSSSTLRNPPSSWSHVIAEPFGALITRSGGTAVNKTPTVYAEEMFPAWKKTSEYTAIESASVAAVKCWFEDIAFTKARNLLFQRARFIFGDTSAYWKIVLYDPITTYSLHVDLSDGLELFA